MKEVQAALSGLGNVGRHFVELLGRKKQELRRSYGLDLKLVGVIELKGSVIDQSGIDTDSLLELPSGVEGILEHPQVREGFSGPEAIISTGADLIVEATPTNVQTGEPALTHVRTALGAVMHVVTLSKGALVVDWPGIMAFAAEQALQVKFSGATAAALPTMDVAEYCLAGMEITELRGILNGTTNYILTRMHQEGIDYETGLREAQELGVAELDPRLDVEGLDTAAKVLVLANAVLGAQLRPQDVEVNGITDITLADVKRAAERGRVIKLIGSAVRKDEDEVTALVEPVELEGNHPLARVHETSKALYYDTVEMGPLMITGGRSDPGGAAAAALKDIINLAREEF